MAGVSFAGVELRKLPPSFRLRLGQLLEDEDAWKKLMCHIPSEVNANVPKYTVEHMRLVERHGQKTGTSCGEILLDEWSTSGKKRPTVEYLLDILVQCKMFRAADYVAIEIIGIEAPERPDSGPSAKVPSEIIRKLQNEGHEDFLLDEVDGLREILERLNNQDNSQGHLVPFHINVIKSGTKDFNEEFSIGKGAFGTVYKLDLRPHGGPALAIKLLNPSSSVVEDQFITEIRVLSEFRHVNLLPLIGYCTNGPQYCLIYEYMEKGSLLDAIACLDNQQPLEWTKRVAILLGIARGLHYLHTAKEKPLIHRDIKSANILLSESFTAKIGDFGLAKSFNSSNQTSALTSTIIGTSAYMAPEAFRGDISPKMDIFSYGVIILEIITGLPPYDEKREGNDIMTYLEEIVEDDDISPLIDTNAGEVDSSECRMLYELSQNCLDDKKKRPTSEQVLRELQNLLTLKN